MVGQGYNLGNSPAENCKNKWKNLKKQIKLYNDNTRRTGAAPMEKPVF